MFQMAPYLYLARAAGEEHQFYDIFFKVWFERWPRAKISSVEELLKKVRTSNTLTEAMLTY
jgi:hypothetical protein